MEKRVITNWTFNVLSTTQSHLRAINQRYNAIFIQNYSHVETVLVKLTPSSSSSLNGGTRWSTTDDFTTTLLHFSLFSTALWDLAYSRPVHSLMLSSHLFLCLPRLHPPFTVPCKMVLARPNEREIWPYHCSLCLSTMVKWSSCGQSACWFLPE